MELQMSCSVCAKIQKKIIFKEKKAEIGTIPRQLREWKGVRIIEAEICPNHVHMLIEIPPKIAVSSFMGCLNGKSSTMLYEQFGELNINIAIENFGAEYIK